MRIRVICLQYKSAAYSAAASEIAEATNAFARLERASAIRLELQGRDELVPGIRELPRELRLRRGCCALPRSPA